MSTAFVGLQKAAYGPGTSQFPWHLLLLFAPLECCAHDPQLKSSVKGALTVHHFFNNTHWEAQMCTQFSALSTYCLQGDVSWEGDTFAFGAIWLLPVRREETLFDIAPTTSPVDKT